ncbi:MAG: sulfatase-like hydrolase/transferase [Planctomycetota bacterium]|jgi:arylsulfatase A-like enzyme
MNNRYIIVTMLLLLPVSSLLGMSPAKAPRRPNILYIMTDQQPVSCVGAYGNPIIKTPHLDKLAEVGCTFHSAYIAAFPCSPSRACQLSGRYAHHHGVTTNDVLFDEKIPSLGNICKAAGYDTAYFGKWHLGGHVYRFPRGTVSQNRHWAWYYKRVADEKGFKFEQIPGGPGDDEPCHGFDTWAGGWKQYRQYLIDVGLGELLKKRRMVGGHNNLPSGREGEHIYSMIPEEHNVDVFLAGHAEKYIRTHADTKRPWCMVLSIFAPHLPVSPPKPWDTMYSVDQVTLPANLRDRHPGRKTGRPTQKYIVLSSR